MFCLFTNTNVKIKSPMIIENEWIIESLGLEKVSKVSGPTIPTSSYAIPGRKLQKKRWEKGGKWSAYNKCM